MKKQFVLLFIFAAICSVNSFAQEYKGAVGLRLGYPVSVSGKYFVSESSAIEGFVGTQGYIYSRSIAVGLAYQKHSELDIIDEVEGLSYYWGFGVNAYFWSYDAGWADDNTSTSFGISGYIGLDYAFEELPINITLDWVPTVRIGSHLGILGGRYGGVGIRYIFARD